MALFRPTYTDKKTGKQKRSGTWWYEFTYMTRRIRESARTTRKTLAIEAQKRRKLELERAQTGAPIDEPGRRIKAVIDFIKSYVSTYGIAHRPGSLAGVMSYTKNVVRLLGPIMLSDLTEDRILHYMKARQLEGAAGRTINGELAELSRAIGRPWSYLWPRVHKLEENADIGQALSPEQESSLLAAADLSRSPNVKVMVRVSLLTGLRAGELEDLQWNRVDFIHRIITVGKSKSEAGRGREIPMNEDLFQVLSGHAAWFTKRFGETRPEYYVFPWGSPFPTDPTRPCVELKTAWEKIRKTAKVECRWHDLRHTVCTKMAEAGVPESTMLDIMGHMSRKMLVRYSHIRMAAKRAAVESLSLTPKSNVPLQESLQVTARTTVQ